MPKFTTRLRRRQLDESLSKIKEINRPPRGYIHEIRNALEMSSYQLAERMGVKQSTVMDMEESERNSTITLRSLERAGASLGCRVVYALVPESSLEEMVSQQARTRAQELSETIFRTMVLEQQATAEKDREELIDELANDVLRKGKRELWKHDKR
jgi:predicted DNA-binding mobile mystery protein A